MSEDKKPHALQKNVAKAGAIRNMCLSEGYKVLMAEVEKEKKRVTEKVLDAAVPDSDIAKFRRDVQVWVELEKILKKIMLTGEFSARAMQNLEAPSNQEG